MYGLKTYRNKVKTFENMILSGTMLTCQKDLFRSNSETGSPEICVLSFASQVFFKGTFYKYNYDKQVMYNSVS